MKELGVIVFLIFVALVIISQVLKIQTKRILEDGIKRMQEIVAKQIKSLFDIIMSITEDDLRNERVVMEIDLRCFAIITCLKIPDALRKEIANLPEGKREIVTKIFWQACNRCSPEIWAEIYLETFKDKDKDIAALRDIINLLNLDLKDKVLKMSQVKFEDYKRECLTRYEDVNELERLHVETMYIIGAMSSRKIWLGVEMN